MTFPAFFSHLPLVGSKHYNDVTVTCWYLVSHDLIYICSNHVLEDWKHGDGTVGWWQWQELLVDWCGWQKFWGQWGEWRGVSLPKIVEILRKSRFCGLIPPVQLQLQRSVWTLPAFTILASIVLVNLETAAVRDVLVPPLATYSEPYPIQTLEINPLTQCSQHPRLLQPWRLFILQ